MTVAVHRGEACLLLGIRPEDYATRAFGEALLKWRDTGVWECRFALSGELDRVANALAERDAKFFALLKERDALVGENVILNAALHDARCVCALFQLQTAEASRGKAG